MMFPVILILFITIPMIEIFLFLQVGSIIGVLATIVLVILTAVIGSYMLRDQGMRTLFSARQSMQQGQMPTNQMAQGLILVFGGALLLTPGFMTDVFGFLCLFPLTRQAIIKLAQRKFSGQVFQGASGFTHHSASNHQTSEEKSERRGHIIEGEIDKEN